MKELSKEEKAKAYDEAKARMSKAFNDNRCTIGFMNEIFPELKESEDERIRKSIIHLVKKSYEQGGYALHKDESEKMLAWLETQGEQKPVVPKFIVGDTVRAKTMNDFVFTIKDITDKQYIDTNGGKFDIEGQDHLELVEQKPVELPNGDDYGIDGLWHAQRILEKTLGNVEGYQSDDGILEHECAISAVNELSKQKPTWSKEDEEAIGEAIIALEAMYNPDEPERRYAGYTLTFDKAAERLKSLRHQNRWKPSEKQIKDLESVINDLDRMHNAVSYIDNHTKKNLIKILEQLKKLREE